MGSRLNVVLPCKVAKAMTFCSSNSAEHTDCNVDANQAMLALHVSWLRSVLQVPHTMVFNAVKLLCPCLVNGT